MNWDDMRFLLAVARTGSISGAARSLEVQHSTVSRRLRAMEQKLGARLVERLKSGYELTQAGERLKQAALHMEQEMLAVGESVLGKDQRLIGRLIVTTINNMATTVLAPMFAQFSREHPELELHVEVSNDYASLAQREADVAIRLTNSPPETLIGKRMVTVASTVYGSNDYLQQINKQKIEPEWIGVNCCGFHKTWTRQSAHHAFHRFYSDDTLLTLAAIKEGLGISYLPCFLGDPVPELGRYCEPDTQHDLGLWLFIHPDMRRVAKVLAFREFMITQIQQQKALFEGTL